MESALQCFEQVRGKSPPGWGNLATFSWKHFASCIALGKNWGESVLSRSSAGAAGGCTLFLAGLPWPCALLNPLLRVAPLWEFRRDCIAHNGLDLVSA